MQNIVVPSRHASPYDRERLQEALRQHIADRRAVAANRPWTRWLAYARLLTAYVLPVDFSSTRSRIIFRIPSIYLLLNSLVLWTVMLLQVAQLYPSHSSYAWINSVGYYVQQRSMDDICWTSFLSASAALFIGALTNGLEGLHTSNNTPFNLVRLVFITMSSMILLWKRS